MMNDPSPEHHVELDRKIRAHEDQAAEDLATVRLLEQQWEEYRYLMRDNTARFEEASLATGANYFAQRGLAARRELDAFVRQLADGQEELLAETARSIRSISETELERLRREKAGASWA